LKRKSRGWGIKLIDEDLMMIVEEMKMGEVRRGRVGGGGGYEVGT